MADEPRPGFLGVFKSVLSSFLGVQKNEVRERDFKHGKPSQFIIIGLIVTVLFIVVIWGVVRLILVLAGV